jgi:hypothetical protein
MIYIVNCNAITCNSKRPLQTMPDKDDPREQKSSPSPLREALRQVESFGQALGEALQGRGNVVMVRVNDETLRYMDMLVEAEMTKSRSESAAFLILEGIRANSALFDKIGEVTGQITRLREQLRESIRGEGNSKE